MKDHEQSANRCAYCPSVFSITRTGGSKKKYCSSKCRLNFNTAKTAKKARLEAITALGGKCSDCGLEDLEVLQIDHVLPIKETREKRLEMRSLCRQIKGGDHNNLQLLCANCHMRKTWRV